MLDRVALNRSLDSIIQQGKEPPSIDDLRGFIVLYNDTLRYIRNHLQESEALKESYPKFPEMIYRDFKKPVDLIRAFSFWLLTLGFFSKYHVLNISNSDPVKRRYYQTILDKIPLVNTVASELIMKLGE